MYELIWRKIRKSWKWLRIKTWNNLLFIAPIVVIIVYIIWSFNNG